MRGLMSKLSPQKDQNHLIFCGLVICTCTKPLKHDPHFTSNDGVKVNSHKQVWPQLCKNSPVMNIPTKNAIFKRLKLQATASRSKVTLGFDQDIAQHKYPYLIWSCILQFWESRVDKVWSPFLPKFYIWSHNVKVTPGSDHNVPQHDHVWNIEVK